MRPKTWKIVGEVAVDVILLLSMAGFAITMSYLKPHHNGLFCDDESIQLPHEKNTVNPALRPVAYLTPAVCIILVELVDKGNWVVRSFRQIGAMLLGGICTEAMIFIAKATTGRLRPHFMDVCKPVNCTVLGYVSNYVCTGDPAMVEEARRSFPSGHAALASYCTLLAALYLNRLSLPSLFIPFVQFFLIQVAFFVGISRITDHQHHSTDVIAGFIIGVVIAVLTDLYLHKLSKTTQTHSLKRSRSI